MDMLLKLTKAMDNKISGVSTHFSIIDIENDKFVLMQTAEKLSDYEYDKVKPVIEELGGHWRERVKGFVFPFNLDIKREGYTEQKELNQFFPTPKAVAKRMVELSEINERNYQNPPFLLEPSAGDGALLDAVSTYTSVRNYMSVYVVEPEESNARKLNEKGYLVEEETFEEFYNKHKKENKHITHVIMNPPFSLRRDIYHTRLAYELMQAGGVLVAVISENSLYYNNADTKKFNDWLKKVNAYIEPVPYGAFAESGTTIDTVIIKIVKE